VNDARELIQRLVRPEIRALGRYHVPDARGVIKLDAMENPYPWPESLERAWLERLRTVELNRYPDPRAEELKARLRQALAVPPGAELLLGNGSDELIQLILLALARPGATAMAPVPTFVMYRQIALAVGMEFAGVPLAADFALDREGFLAALASRRPAVVFVSWPNNPTGNLFERADVEAVIAAAPGLVVLDEAYHAFAGATFMDRLAVHPNLLVMRTFSKQGMAGLRLGVLAGAPAWLDVLERVRLPYNINSLTQASAAFALEHAHAFSAQCRAIVAERARLHEALARLPGVDVWPSRTNFLLFRVSGRAGEVHAGLRAAGVLVKNLDDGGALAGCLRVTVGTPSENDAFLTALAGLL
jgi:histidinol-phosphate aminotransferase